MTWASHRIPRDPGALERWWGHLTCPKSWRAGMPGLWLPPAPSEGPGEPCPTASWMSHCCPLLLFPTTFRRSLVLPLLVPGQKGISPTWAQEGGHSYLRPEAGDLSCVPFSRQTQRGVLCVACLPSASCLDLPAVQLGRPISPQCFCLCCVSCLVPAPPLHLPKASLPEGPGRCQCHF